MDGYFSLKNLRPMHNKKTMLCGIDQSSQLNHNDS